jgi:branched-chain amino acid aminotransferase
MAEQAEHPKYLWLNGKLVPWEDATVHVSMLGWSTMSAVFEGIRAYANPDDGQLYAHQLNEHYRRFARSMKLQRMNCPWSSEELIAASVELLRANEYRGDTYLSPLAYLGDATFYGLQLESSTHVRIIANPMTSHLESGRIVRACVSSWTRISDNVMSPRIKAVANYQNSRLAAVEAKQNGYDQPILLNPQGKVTEGGGSCLFFVRDGVAVTPSTTSGILESVTRATILQLCQEALNIPTWEREVDRSELYVADEVFFCGTGAEILPVASIDGYTIRDGRIGPLTSRIESLFHRIVRRRETAYSQWSTPVYVPVASATPV